MKRSWTAMGGILLVLTLANMVLASNKDTAAGPLTGTWAGTAHGAEGDMEFMMALQQSGEDVKGSVSTQDGGQLEITSGTFKDGALEFHCETPDAKYLVTGKLKDGQLSGEWSMVGDGQKGTWEAKKSQEKPATQ